MATAVIIHAGLPKTGTTYLQQRFVDNRAWLAARGTHYPTIGQEYGPGHHNLAQVFRGQPVAEPWSQASPADCLEAAGVGAHETVLLSSETFSSLHMDQAAALKAAIGSHQITWVLYLRRRSDVVLSRWQEDVKHGSTRTFAEYLTAQLLGAGDVLRIEDSVAVALRTFGRSSLRLVVLDELTNRGIDLFDHFAQQVLGLPSDGAMPASAPANNASLPMPTVETLRALNAAQPGNAAWADGGADIALAAHQHLHKRPDGQALLRDVTSLFEASADTVDLRQLDQQWLNRDHEILHACGSQVLNPASETRLFPDAPPRSVRTLRPSVLYQQIPAARFQQVRESIEAGIGS